MIIAHLGHLAYLDHLDHLDHLGHLGDKVASAAMSAKNLNKNKLNLKLPHSSVQTNDANAVDNAINE